MEDRSRRRCGEQKQNYVKIFTHTHTQKGKRQNFKYPMNRIESNRIDLIIIIFN